MGGTASLVAAAQEGTDAAVVVTLSAPTSIEGLDADAALLQRVGANKLFIAGVGDAAAAASAEQLYEIAPPPKAAPEIVPADDHGTDLLTGSREKRSSASSRPTSHSSRRRDAQGDGATLGTESPRGPREGAWSRFASAIW